jgi:pimeloyl-ACP methyl ester carboxylesterase
LLILLPGADMSAKDFVDHDFVGEIQRNDAAIDILCVDSSVDLYLDNTIVAELHALIPAPPPRRLWLAGISLGGMGALLYDRAHPGTVEGIILLSPYLGPRGIVDEVAAAGGLAHWSAEPDEDEALNGPFLRWLAAECQNTAATKFHLGYGREDRFVRAHQMLAEALPTDRVTAIDGGHDWQTWKVLWREILMAAPFTRQRS